MKLRKMLNRIFTLACASALLFASTVSAEIGGNDPSYTYTVTLYSGNQGTFNGAAGVSVSGSGQVSYVGEDEIRITGLNYGDRVSVSSPSGMVTLEDGSKYYVKGIRESGRDNNTVGSSSFRVDSDREYVIAYGIRGNMVSYLVNYVDGEGNELAPSETFYGVVGDRPVVAFRYVDGYQPQAYNLTGTLVSNEADNVFTFVYRRIVTDNGQTGTGDGSETGTDGGAAGNGTDTGTAGSGTAGSGTAGSGASGGTAGTGTDTGTTGNNTGSAGAANGTVSGTAGTGSSNGGTGSGGSDETDTEDGTDTGSDEPEELIDIDEDDTPLGSYDDENAGNERPAGDMPLFIIIAAVAVLGICIAAFVYLKFGRNRRK